MNKRLTKPHEKNVRLDSPLGLLGVPPDCYDKATVLRGKTVIIVNGDLTILPESRRTSLPQ